MKRRNNPRIAGCLLALGLTGLAPIAAQAQAQPMSDTWQFELAIYGWFPAISGSTAFPSTGNSGPYIDVSSSDVISALKMVFMGQAEARKGQWGVWTDLVYADLGGSKSASRDYTVGGRPVNATANLGLDVKSTVWTLAGLYNVSSMPENTTDLLFGARMLNMKQTLNWELSNSIPQLPGRSGEASADETDWDAIVGIKGRYYLGADRRWFLPYYADLGGGQSKFTWQVNAGVGYRFDWGSTFLTYRYLDYEFKSGNLVQSLTLSGALLGVAFQF